MKHLSKSPSFPFRGPDVPKGVSDDDFDQQDPLSVSVSMMREKILTGDARTWAPNDMIKNCLVC